MAVNDSRSMNMDLIRGAGDGKFKSLTPSRGGEVDPTSATIRKEQLQIQYNVQTSPDFPNYETHLR
jgi:hypothetical protein